MFDHGAGQVVSGNHLIGEQHPKRRVDRAQQPVAEIRFLTRLHGVDLRGPEYVQPPLLCLQHFMGTLDNWDPAVTDALARRGEVILFESAGIGRSSGKVPVSVAGMAEHALAFLDGLGIGSCDVLGFSLGGMVAQQIALDRPSIFRKMVLVGTAPRGGEDIMHLEKPSLAKPLQDPSLKGYSVLQKIFFAPTESSQSAGEAFVGRLTRRKEDREPVSGPDVAQAQMAAFRDWEKFTGRRFAELAAIRQPSYQRATERSGGRRVCECTSF